jgi:mannosyltransferase
MKKNEKILLTLVFIFCLSLRLAFITQKNLWFDELYSWRIIQGSFKDILFSTASDIHPPLFYIILKIWVYAFGDSVFSMRLLTALFTSSAVFFIYPVSRRILSVSNSFLVLILYSLSPLNLFFSQEVRMSSLNVLLNTASVYYLIRLIESNLKIKRFFTNGYTYLFILFSALAIYTHYFSFLMLFAEALYLLFIFRKNLKYLIHYLIVYASIAIIYIVWIPIMLVQVSKGQPWRNVQNISQVLNKVLLYTRDISIGFYHRYMDVHLLNVLTMIVLILVVLLIVGFILDSMNKRRAGGSVEKAPNFKLLILLLVLVPIIMSMIIASKQSIEFFRYLSILVPFIIILGFIGFHPLPIQIKSAGLGLFLIINIYGDYLYYRSDFKNDDYREIISTINSNYRNAERVYVYPHYFGWGIIYYCKENRLRFDGADNYGWEYSSLLDTLNSARPESFWFVMDYHSADSSTYSEKLKNIEYSYKENYVRTFNIIPNKVILYRFQRK